MKRFGLLILLALSLATAASAEKLRVLLTFGGHGFQEKEFFAMWDAFPDVVYTKAPLPQSADLLKPGLETNFDVIVMYDMVKTLTTEQRAAFVALLKRGIGVVALHHNLGANNDWDEYRRIIGGKWLNKPETIDGQTFPKSSYSHGETIAVTIADKTHPITAGLRDYTIHDETYGHVYVAPGVHVLLTTNHPKNVPTLAWTTSYGNSRVFYLQHGHDAAAWGNPNFQLLLTRGMRWAAQRD